LQKHIQEIIKHIEKDFSVKVLFACEAGSRAWGASNQTSDYDIRFIYLHPIDWYLSIDPKRDVIEIPKNDHITIPVHKLIDMTGWELSKTLRLLRKSNPSLLEWVHSNMVYYNAYETMEKLKELSKLTFSAKVCLFHNLNMAKNNFRVCLQDKEANLKRYLNVIRPILAAKWIEKNKTFPPIKYSHFLEDLSLDENFKKYINQLLQLKMVGGETSFPNKGEMNEAIKSELDHLELHVNSLSNNQDDYTPLLDRYFRKLLRLVWGSV
jgi:uncharacterized protein